MGAIGDDNGVIVGTVVNSHQHEGFSEYDEIAAYDQAWAVRKPWYHLSDGTWESVIMAIGGIVTLLGVLYVLSLWIMKHPLPY